MLRLLLGALLVTLLAADITDITTLKARFVQTVTNDQNQTITYEGRVYLKPPHRGLWIYDTPVEKSIYLTPEAITVYEPELLQATVLRPRNELNLLKIFKEAKPVSPGESVATVGEKAVHIKHSGGLVTRLFFTDKLENSVTIRFFDHEINQPIPDTLFEFIPEPGTDIIRE